MSAVDDPRPTMRRPDSGEFPFGPVRAVAFAVVCAILVFSVLSVVAAPPHWRERVEALTRKTAEIERIAGGLSGMGDYKPGAVCEGGTLQGGSALERRAESVAGALGVELAEVEVEAGVASTASGLAPVAFSLAATAEYDALIVFLAQLGQGQPDVFVDTAKLTPNVSVANLTLTGRVFCWTSARH